MAQHERFILTDGLDHPTAMAAIYETFEKLQWQLLYAEDDRLIAIKPSPLGKNGQQVGVTWSPKDLTVVSYSPKKFDLGNNNKNNVNTFIDTFQKVAADMPHEKIYTNLIAIENQQQETRKFMLAQQAEYDEVNKAMNIGGGNLYATYTIIGLNVIIFILMFFDGAGLFEVNGLVHIKWGSDVSALVFTGDWWRLITHMFLHFGIFHIALNMYCFYSIGTYLEPMLGKPKFVVAYLCAGVFGGLASLWWHTQGANGAGASGAIFGMYGLFLALLTTDLIPKSARKALLQSIVMFIVLNLAIGTQGNIDNSAHIGGLLSGFVIGYIYAFAIRRQKKGQHTKWVLPLVTLLTVALAALFLQQHKNDFSQKDRQAILDQVKTLGFKDTEKFADTYEKFAAQEKKALQTKPPENPTENWNAAWSFIKEMQLMDVSPDNHKLADNLLKYVELRQAESKLILQGSQGPGFSDSLNMVQQHINSLIDSMKNN
jgi:rhomboid protease GluP